MLVPSQAPYLKDSSLLIAADCTAIAYASIHQDFIKGRVTLMGCPKLDDSGAYIEKLSEIIKHNRIKSVTVAMMEVPCCGGMAVIAQEAIKLSGKEVPLIREMISISGELM